MVDIESPDDVNVAVKLLPLTQLPYTVQCPLSRELQSILFHYDVSYAAVSVLVDNDFTKKKMFRRADPEGDDDQRALFGSVAAKLNPLQRVLMRDAFVRILSAAPMEPVVAPPPKKKSKADDVKSSDKSSADKSSSHKSSSDKSSSSKSSSDKS